MTSDDTSMLHLPVQFHIFHIILPKCLTAVKCPLRFKTPPFNSSFQELSRPASIVTQLLYIFTTSIIDIPLFEDHLCLRPYFF